MELTPLDVPAPVASPAVPQPTVCPQCHVPVRVTDFFCFNCGKNLRPKPLATSVQTLVMYYLGAIILPPMGIIWGLKYLRQGNQTAKIHGLILIILTIIELIVLTVWTVNLMQTINAHVGSQLNGLQGL